MKLKKHLAALKKQTGIKPGAPRSTSTSSGPWPFRRWAILGFCLLLAFGGTWAFSVFVLWNRVPSELVGKWVVMEGPDEGGTVDFNPSGAMVAIVNKGGFEAKIEARIRVDGKKIHVTTWHRETGEEGTRIQTIKVQEADRLVLEDERGTSIKLKRAR